MQRVFRSLQARIRMLEGLWSGTQVQGRHETHILKTPKTGPLTFLEDLSQACEAGNKKGIWIPTQFNEYGIPVVPIHKAPAPGQKKAKLRVCGDYSVTVNQQLETHWHPIPSPDDLMQRLKWWLLLPKDRSGRCVQPGEPVTRKPTAASTQYSSRDTPTDAPTYLFQDISKK